MRWNKEIKLKLYKVLRAKFVTIVACQHRPGTWNQSSAGEVCNKLINPFLESFGIQRIQKIKESHAWRHPGRKESWVWCDPKTKEPVNKAGHIIILDPVYSPEPIENNWSPASGEGLKIPKEVAEKFVVLGFPENLFPDS